MEVTIQVQSPDEAMVLFGLGDQNLKLLRDRLDVELTARGKTLRVAGDQTPVESAAAVLNDMMELYRSGRELEPGYLERRLKEIDGAEPDAVAGDGTDDGNGNGGDQDRASRSLIQAAARSAGQARYMNAILDNGVVFCIGPAGTGKTFLAVRMAVHLLRAGEIRRLILCRPAVEAGEKLGFLPGDFQAKINPYLRPLYDALNDILDYDQVRRYMEREIIEIIPLAYMRGRTLNNAFIILDEGQNTTISQMKMFLTRMGMNSKIVVNGDITQVDLPDQQRSGLIHAKRVVRRIKGIEWVHMEKVDIVRHPLVGRIVDAYEEAEKKSTR